MQSKLSASAFQPLPLTQPDNSQQVTLSKSPPQTQHNTEDEDLIIDHYNSPSSSLSSDSSTDSESELFNQQRNQTRSIPYDHSTTRLQQRAQQYHSPPHYTMSHPLTPSQHAASLQALEISLKRLNSLSQQHSRETLNVPLLSSEAFTHHHSATLLSHYNKRIAKTHIYCNGLIHTGPSLKPLLLIGLMIALPSGVWLWCVSRLWQEWSYVVFIILLLIVVVSVLRTALSDPGVIQRSTCNNNNNNSHNDSCNVAPSLLPIPDPYLFKPRLQTFIVQGNNHLLLQLKYCQTCNLYRTQRTVHCAICNHCCDGFDHHCTWIGCCIGKRNYRVFTLFLLSLTTLTTFVFTSTFFILIQQLQRQSLLETLISFPLQFILSIYCLFAMLFLIGLTSFHCYLITQQLTTNESLKRTHLKRAGHVNPYSFGNAVRNCLALICSVDEDDINHHYNGNDSGLQCCGDGWQESDKIRYVTAQEFQSLHLQHLQTKRSLQQTEAYGLRPDTRQQALIWNPTLKSKRQHFLQRLKTKQIQQHKINAKRRLLSRSPFTSQHDPYDYHSKSFSTSLLSNRTVAATSLINNQQQFFNTIYTHSRQRSHDSSLTQHLPPIVMEQLKQTLKTRQSVRNQDLNSSKTKSQSLQTVFQTITENE